MKKSGLRAVAWVIESSLEGMFAISHEWPLRYPRTTRVIGALAFGVFAVLAAPLGAVMLLCNRRRRMDVIEARAEMSWNR